jgi:transposase
VLPDSVVYTDSFNAYNALYVSGFHPIHGLTTPHYLQKRETTLMELKASWKQAKRHFRRFKGIKSQNFYCF